MEYLYKDETYKIIGAALEVHKELGCGFLEPVYQEALEKELLLQNIPFTREKILPIYYKGMLLEKTYRVDFLCYDKIIVELKALSALMNEHHAQVINYLKATDFQIGLLINFGNQSLDYKRIICENLRNLRTNNKR